MPRKTRRLARRKTPRLLPFDFAALNEVMSKNSVKCNHWRANVEPDCSNMGAFFDGHERVFAKYKSIFLDRYTGYMALTINELIKKVPYMPSRQCKQIVIGAGEDIILYIAINNKCHVLGLPMPFTLFMPPQWDAETNLLFTQCAVAHRLNNCAGKFFIRILLPKNLDRLLDASGSARISLLEICTISKYVRDMNLRCFIYKTPATFDYDIVFI
jgi:hypothetical protein